MLIEDKFYPNHFYVIIQLVKNSMYKILDFAKRPTFYVFRNIFLYICVMYFIYFTYYNSQSSLSGFLFESHIDGIIQKNVIQYEEMFAIFNLKLAHLDGRILLATCLRNFIFASFIQKHNPVASQKIGLVNSPMKSDEQSNWRA